MIRIGIPVRSHKGRYVVNQDYVLALLKANAEAVVILPNSDLDDLLPTLKGLLIPGGGDVDPNLYDEQCTTSEDIDTVIDALDLQLIHKAIALNLEIFGICRGLQIINVALGGSLIQDIPQMSHSKINHNVSALHKTPTQGHLITILPNTNLATVLPHTIEVNTYHHQAIKKLADGLSVSALASDTLIEAVEGNHIIAVQWHPERMIQDSLFQNLFDDFVKRCSL